MLRRCLQPFIFFIIRL